ncbi:nuclear transport factor 2 family protein [Lacimicrobium alkaliphilum]|uniref:DUF4440 domain-containing protein n=1 Tax=Lacimicrobium alkaliphilum TaxID=1526571 RepID=A0A0U3AW97_9ALTE|nr:nuclear transport factor 2 family protein [Lacimicrobium alkaliphilum]ALS98351.1 hypothetical protein AT746_08850 [Lacimicrobium alkaliphilum]
MRYLIFVLLFTINSAAAAEQSGPESVVAKLWQGISHEPNQASDVALLEQLFHPDGTVYGVRYTDNAPDLSKVTVTEFLKALEKEREAGFYECEVFRKMQVYDRFATVYSVVESRTDKQAVEPDFTGVNSIQLYKEGQQWKILSLYYQVENPAIAIPLQSGQSGKCLP